VEIYTDVDGVMSTDPRTCDGASVLDVIGAEELFQLAQHGSKVVHTPAAELALGSGLAVRVKNTFSDHDGTLVADLSGYTPAGVATAVTHIDGISRVTVPLPGEEGSAAHMSAQTRIYRAMAEAGISLDMFTPAAGTLVFTVRSGQVAEACGVLKALGLGCAAREGLSKVTLVGAGMHGVPGVMAAVADYLAEAGVHVLQTADSHTTISVLSAAEEAGTAVNALHAGFNLAAGA
jgi:aspartate kinase